VNQLINSIVVKYAECKSVLAVVPSPRDEIASARVEERTASREHEVIPERPSDRSGSTFPAGGNHSHFRGGRPRSRDSSPPQPDRLSCKCPADVRCRKDGLRRCHGADRNFSVAFSDLVLLRRLRENHSAIRAAAARRVGAEGQTVEIDLSPFARIRLSSRPAVLVTQFVLQARDGCYVSRPRLS
jgi:hypothetical protein